MTMYIAKLAGIQMHKPSNNVKDGGELNKNIEKCSLFSKIFHDFCFNCRKVLPSCNAVVFANILDANETRVLFAVTMESVLDVFSSA